MQVIWLQTALEDLARIWTDADGASRKLITNATHQIDLALKNDPASQGESREFDERVFFANPLGVLFKVEPSSNRVFVHSVWHFRQHR
jgi:ParE toxin of type II toxin-antitoxin system, parDE